MFPYHLLHPYHIIPSVKLVTTVIEFANKPVAKMLMKLFTVFIKILILNLWIRYTRIHIKYSPALKLIFKRTVQHLSFGQGDLAGGHVVVERRAGHI